MPVKSQPRGILRSGVFELDLRTGELRKKGVRIKLQEQPFQVLAVLMQRSGGLVTRDELRSEIWPQDTFVDFDNGLNAAINKVREALGDSSRQPRFIETIPRRGYRFIAAVVADGGGSRVPLSARQWWKLGAAAGLLIVAASVLLAGLIRRPRNPRHLTDADSIVLAEFTNSTGDPVFDATLRQGLSVQLEQSPFLNVMSDQKIRQTLILMRQEPDVRLTPELAQEVCRRTNSAATLVGSIALVGAHYNLILKAADCASGDVIASSQLQVKNKSDVLDALAKLASELRVQLGESLRTVERYNTPLVQATTPSLEALQSYSLGILSEEQTGSFAASVPFFERAADLDPTFASAYLYMSDAYTTLGETMAGVRAMQKAFDLRTKVSERERLLIEGDYYTFVTGDLLKARHIFEISAKVYPRNHYVHNMLGEISNMLGDYQKGLDEYREAVRLAPANTIMHRHVAYTYLLLDRATDAADAARKAQTERVDSDMGPIRYAIAFYTDDRSEMMRQVAKTSGKMGEEDLLLAMEADTAAYFGRLQEARGLSRRARDSAQRAGAKETAATYDAVSNLREALFGNTELARQQVKKIGRESTARDVDFGLALALAYTGDTKGAEKLIEGLERHYPQDTIVRYNYVPVLRAKLALVNSNPKQAIEILETATRYELGLPSYSLYNWPNLYPLYVRGEAYLGLHDGAKAAAEFQKVLHHRGIVLNEPIGTLARLQRARACQMTGDTLDARSAYQEFLTLWKDADPDIPILKQAKVEYDKLQ